MPEHIEIQERCGETGRGGGIIFGVKYRPLQSALNRKKRPAYGTNVDRIPMLIAYQC